MKTGYFPAQWKIAQIIMTPELGKLLEEIISCRPIIRTHNNDQNL
jgi:hypothetical protein